MFMVEDSYKPQYGSTVSSFNTYCSINSVETITSISMTIHVPSILAKGIETINTQTQQTNMTKKTTMA